ncbi:MAG TPA: tetratricopeptide repeat protein [Phycisphaerales bacterium]|nr:tetratricopeptide repeat protein [Phycisphaerales bacterium]
MVSLAGMQVELFGPQLPSLDHLKHLKAKVHRSERAQRALAEQIEQHLDNPLAAGIGRVLLGQMDRAAELLDQAPACMEKSLYLAYAYRGMGRYTEALAALEQAAREGADSLLVALEKVATLRMAHEFEQAAAELAACGNYEKVSAEFHYQRGRLAAAQGQYEAAIADFQIAVELDGNHLEALFQLAYACDLRGTDQEALAYYQQLVQRPTPPVNALLNLAMLYEEAGEYDKAARCVATVLASHPNHPKARLFAKDIDSSRTMVYDEEQARRKDQQARILEIPLSDFELSVRSRNCLKKMNLNTLGDLLRITEVELLSYKNFGETSLQEIKRILDSKGLRLGMALESGTSSYAAQAQASGASEEVLSKCVDDVELSVRSRRCLSRLNIRTLGDLIMRTEAELLGCKNFGVTSLNEIKDRLAEYGLSLRKLE